MLVRFSFAQTSDAALASRLSRLEDFLVGQFNSTVGLVRESPDSEIAPAYWLLSDNLIAMHVLQQDHPTIAAQINRTMQKYEIWTDGLHEALFGDVTSLPPYTPIVKVVENNSFLIEVEVRSNRTGEFQPDWTRYADLLCYGALSAYNSGNYLLADYYFGQALQMWNGAGLWDLPTQRDGFYSVYKLALLTYAADKLNQTIPYRTELEARIWQFQRADGGIRAFYLGNMTSNREANSETAGLVLLAYQFRMHKDAMIAQQQAEIIAQQEAQARMRMIEELVTVAILIVGLTAFEIKKRQIQKRLNRDHASSSSHEAE
jgi:hypothetical protein